MKHLRRFWILSVLQVVGCAGISSLGPLLRTSEKKSQLGADSFTQEKKKSIDLTQDLT